MASEQVSDARVAVADRRDGVLVSALETFVRFGYRKTSMDRVADDAQISRPGLYYMFSSKQALFRAAVSRALDADLAEVELALGKQGAPLAERTLDAFDCWAGRYIGPLAKDVVSVIDADPGLLGDMRDAAPRRFHDLVTAALAQELSGGQASDVAQTLESASIGIKQQVGSRAEYAERMRVAVRVVLR